MKAALWQCNDMTLPTHGTSLCLAVHVSGEGGGCFYLTAWGKGLFWVAQGSTSLLVWLQPERTKPFKFVPVHTLGLTLTGGRSHFRADRLCKEDRCTLETACCSSQCLNLTVLLCPSGSRARHGEDTSFFAYTETQIYFGLKWTRIQKKQGFFCHVIHGTWKSRELVHRCHSIRVLSTR